MPIWIITPSVVIIIISFSSVTALTPTTFPVFSVILWHLTPLPPRFCTVNSSSSVLLPIPFSDTIKSESPCVSICMPTISSPSSKFIPITPIAVLPIARTSVSLKRIHIPYLVIKKISLFLEVVLTSINSSSSRKWIAASPVFLTFMNSIIGVFLAIPFFVIIKRFLPSS